MKIKNLKRVYVWERPVRVFHWLNVILIVVLCVTGYLIGNPPIIQDAQEASFGYWFGTVRFIHFVAAYIFLFNYIFRVYWGFVGNEWANWKEFIPTNKKYFTEIMSVLRQDILLIKVKPYHSFGHNALAGFSYFMTFIAFLFQVITGFALYADMSNWWFPQLFTWVQDLFGDDFSVRHIHHILMWFFVIFSMIHIHLVIYHDLVEGRGEISSMGGGWKFIEEEIIEKHQSKS